MSPGRIVCRVCGKPSPRRMKFCGHCGAALHEAGPDPQDAPKAQIGERRLLTVMFCDLASSTRLASLLEPEDLRHVFLAFRTACAEAIERFGGTVGQYLGDGILAYFGHPRAMEDDAQRALRAALMARASMAAVQDQFAAAGLRLPFPLAVRIGVHSGLVVVGDLGTGRNSEAAAVVGETTSIAARLQSAAAVGTILTSDTTMRLAGDRFDCIDRGMRDLPGLGRAVGTFEVRAERSRSDAVTASAVARFAYPFFNRVTERALLRQAWDEAAQGRGVCIAIEAEPGMGKTRLISEFRASLGAAGAAAVVLSCSAEDRASSFHPLLTWIRAEFGGGRGDGPPDLRAWLRTAFGTSGTPGQEIQLAVLLDCASEEERRMFARTPRRRRHEIVDVLVDLVTARIRQDRPQLFIVEDLHWADAGTAEFIRAFARRCGTSQTMLLLTGRPDPARHGLASAVLRLDRLPDGDAVELVRSIVPRQVGDDVIREIVRRTDGIPLFAEEVARLESQPDRPGRSSGIPLTLRGTLAAQLDALGAAKSVAQTASALGRSFQPEVLEALVADQDRPRTARAIARLLEDRLIEPDGTPGDSPGYVFRHALIRDVAYDSIVRERREALHGRIAETLRQGFAGTPQGRPEILARHYASAGKGLEAAHQFQAAAVRAAERSIHGEGADHCRAALEQLAKAPPTPQVVDLETRVQVLLAAQITALRGNADPEVEAAFERARFLAEHLEDKRWLRRALRGLHTFHLVRGDVITGLRISLEVIGLSTDENEPGHRIQVHRPHGLTLLYLGRFEEARTELLAAIALYDPAVHADHRFSYGSDPLVLARSHMGWVSWFLGDVGGAVAESDAAIEAAAALDHPHSLCFALAFRACLAEFMGDAATARATAQRLVEIAERHDYAYWSAWGRIIEGWAAAELGNAEQGEADLRRGLAEYEVTGAGLLVPYAHILLAQVARRAGRAEQDRLLAFARQAAERGGMGIWTELQARRSQTEADAGDC